MSNPSDTSPEVLRHAIMQQLEGLEAEDLARVLHHAIYLSNNRIYEGRYPAPDDAPAAAEPPRPSYDSASHGIKTQLPTDFLDEMTPSQAASFIRSVKQGEAGQVTPHKEVIEELQAWLDNQ